MNDQKLFTEPHIWLNPEEKGLDQHKLRITTVVDCESYLVISEVS